MSAAINFDVKYKIAKNKKPARCGLCYKALRNKTSTGYCSVCSNRIRAEYKKFTKRAGTVEKEYKPSAIINSWYDTVDREAEENRL